MNQLLEKENSYVQELKSLFQDKFFMLLLGISVAIVLLSTVYSIIKPKNVITANAEKANEAQSTNTADDLMVKNSEGLAGLEDSNDQTQEEPTVTQAPRPTDMPKATVAPTNAAPEVKAEAVKKEEPTKISKPKVSQYVVKAGDTLWDIAEANYGSGYNFSDIAVANKLADANVIDIGQKLTLPGSAIKQPSTNLGEITPDAAMTKKGDEGAKTHTVLPGEDLWSISLKYFGNGYEWSRLASTNKVVNPDIIYPNQLIVLRK